VHPIPSPVRHQAPGAHKPKEGNRMDSKTRFKALTTGRGGELRNIVQSMTNAPRDFPTKSALRAALAEVYPDNPELSARHP